MFQVVLMLLLATNYIPVVVNHLLMAFYSARVPFTCQVRLVCMSATGCPAQSDTLFLRLVDAMAESFNSFV